MLALILTALLPAAMAQNDTALEVAPEGCWGDVLHAVPAMGAQDVPTDIAPRFFMNGLCDEVVTIELRGSDDTVLPTTLDANATANGTTFIVHPNSELAANTDFTLSITPDFGAEVALTFSTGEDRVGETPELTVARMSIDGWCDGRGTGAFAAMVQLDSNRDGFVGFATGSPEWQTSYQAITVVGGVVDLWLPVPAALGDAEGCLSYAALGDDGTLGEWQEICDTLPDIGTCRTGVFNNQGCGRGDEVTPVTRDAFFLVPLLPLFALALRRRRDA